MINFYTWTISLDLLSFILILLTSGLNLSLQLRTRQSLKKTQLDPRQYRRYLVLQFFFHYSHSYPAIGNNIYRCSHYWLYLYPSLRPPAFCFDLPKWLLRYHICLQSLNSYQQKSLGSELNQFKGISIQNRRGSYIVASQ